MYGDRHAIRRGHVLRATSSNTVWPGDCVELELPAELAKVNEGPAFELHKDCRHWFVPSLFVGASGKIRIPVLTDAPEDIDVDVEYVNPSFLVKKCNGGFRLVTAFADVCKPQPSLMLNVDATLCLIAQWRYIIAPYQGILPNSIFQIFYEVLWGGHAI